MDLEKLQGVWWNGPAAITIDGDRFTTTQMGAEYAGRVVLDETASPKAITLHFETGPEKGNTNYGIYEFGDEGWRFSLNITGGPAPTEFVSPQMMTRGQATVATQGKEPVAELQGEWLMVFCVREGVAIPDAFAKQGRRTIAGMKSTLYFGSQLFMQGTLSSDGPGMIRLESATGGGPQLGIFEFVGDTVRTCMGGARKARPNTYASTKSGGETYAIWKRP
jgi:uncharacterized protein (TIGR03067 family)